MIEGDRELGRTVRRASVRAVPRLIDSIKVGLTIPSQPWSSDAFDGCLRISSPTIGQS